MDSVDNVNHAVSVVGEWIFYSNYEKSLPFNIFPLHLFCDCFDKEAYFGIVQEVYYAVRCVKKKAESKFVHK